MLRVAQLGRTPDTLPASAHDFSEGNAPAMKDKKPPNPFSGKFIEFCDEEAKRITSILVESLQEGEAGRNFKLSDDDIGLLAFVLSDELVHFFWNSMKLHIQDPDGMKTLNRISSRVAARKSAVKRSTGSTKQKFIEYAIKQNRRNPELSKGAIAEMFARENPGTSVTTLRRYLAAIPTEGDD